MLRVGWPAAGRPILFTVKSEFMNFFFLHPFKLKPVEQQEEEHSLVALHETADQNSSEGGEFLDDALRIEDMATPPADNFKTTNHENMYVTSRSDGRVQG
jgi:hypothetical protein